MTASIPTPGRRFDLPLPGGTSISHVQVYDTVGPDGLAGGSPHLHTACTEAYLVISGAGRVQTLSGDGFRETELERGVVAWFSPGTIHRLINDSGDLELYVVMSNAGLPEAGDMVLAFAPEIVSDESRYRSAAILPPGAIDTDGSTDPARVRRDLAVEGFGHWRRQVEADGAAALAPLYDAAIDRVSDAATRWNALVDEDPAGELESSRRQIDAVVTDRVAAAAHLASSSIRDVSLRPEVRRMGCCGTLGTVFN